MALAVSNSDELSLIVKATIVLALTLVAAVAARRARASVRHVLLTSAFGVLLTLPAIAMLLPPLAVTVASAPAAAHREVRVKAIRGNDLVYYSNVVEDVSAPSLAGPSPRLSALLRVAWTAGAFLFLAPVGVALWRLRRLRRRAAPWLPATPVARMIARHAGVLRPIDVLLSETIATPLTCGCVRPAIVMPVDAQSWSDTDVRRALVHELEHVRRADWPVQLAARSVCALYWFHPLAWIAWRHLCLESERACDDAVLRSAESADYAEQLVTLAARVSHYSFQPALSMAGRSDLAARVRALLDGRQARGRAGLLRAVSVAGLVGLLALTISPLRAVGRSQTQTPAAGPTFEVASVKPNNSGDGRVQIMNQPGGRFTATNVTLRLLIRQAYQLQDSQIVGGPSWLNDDHYDIVAKADGSQLETPSVAQARGGGPTPVQMMIRAMLAERFNLVVHNESREMPIYALILARSDGKLGPEMKKSEIDCTAVAARGRGPGGPPPGGPSGPGQPMPCGIRIGMGTLTMGGASLTQFANSLGMFVGRLVFDRTGLTGGWDLNLTWTPDNMPQRPPGAPDGPIDPNGPSIFTAIQEQLGLKLDSQRGPVDVLVIDKAEHPTPD
ncbi:MAG: TIGR03435 family protein [Acidobacteria bacterium]|nr:TIGR03435 family protein [Acidobacteriota bacterium]